MSHSSGKIAYFVDFILSNAFPCSYLCAKSFKKLQYGK